METVENLDYLKTDYDDFKKKKSKNVKRSSIGPKIKRKLKTETGKEEEGEENNPPRMNILHKFTDFLIGK